MKKLFIIPFRDREAEKCVFINQMRYVLEDDDYELIFVHQKDKRPFNRGALKNIGFLYGKTKFPQNYKNMTFIFHDVDTVPYKKGLFDYETMQGVVKHYFGFRFALGGMFAIKGVDFEKIYGFPNFWGWGFEDNKIQKKWLSVGGKIDRSQFKRIHHPDIVGFHHGAQSLWHKQANKKNVTFAQGLKNDQSGFNTLKNIKYTEEILENNIKMLHVTDFETEKSHTDSAHDWEVGYPRKKYIDHKIPTMGEILRTGRRRTQRR